MTMSKCFSNSSNGILVPSTRDRRSLGRSFVACVRMRRDGGRDVSVDAFRSRREVDRRRAAVPPTCRCARWGRAVRLASWCALPGQVA